MRLALDVLFVPGKLGTHARPTQQLARVGPHLVSISNGSRRCGGGFCSGVKIGWLGCGRKRDEDAALWSTTTTMVLLLLRLFRAFGLDLFLQSNYRVWFQGAEREGSNF